MIGGRQSFLLFFVTKKKERKLNLNFISSYKILSERKKKKDIFDCQILLQTMSQYRRNKKKLLRRAKEEDWGKEMTICVTKLRRYLYFSGW